MAYWYFFMSAEEIKINKLKKFLPIFKACPYTRLIFLAGSVAENTATPTSDIDLVIVAQARRLWLNRLLMELLAFVFMARRGRKKAADRFCFNMFLSNSKPWLPHRDEIGAESYRHLEPVWFSDFRELENFWRENLWLKKFAAMDLTNKIIFEPKKILSDSIRNFLENFLEKTKLVSCLEKISYRFQLSYIKNAYQKCGGERNIKADFFITPDLAAYHFPVSNYYRALEKSNKSEMVVEKNNFQDGNLLS